MGCCDDSDTPQLIDVATLLGSPDSGATDNKGTEPEESGSSSTNNNNNNRAIVKIAAGNIGSSIVIRNISISKVV